MQQIHNKNSLNDTSALKYSSCIYQHFTNPDNILYTFTHTSTVSIVPLRPIATCLLMQHVVISEAQQSLCVSKFRRNIYVTRFYRTDPNHTSGKSN